MENKTGKYFKYAIGEIILVVIGILIALQVSNWNQKRLANLKMESYYTKLIEEVKGEIVITNEFIEEHKNLAEMQFKALEIFNSNNDNKIPEFIKNLGAVPTSWSTDYSFEIFDEFMSQGLLSGIQDLELKNSLMRLQDELGRVDGHIRYIDNQYNTLIEPYFARHINYEQIALPQYKRDLKQGGPVTDFKALFKSMELWNVITLKLETTNSTIGRLETMLSVLNDLKSNLQRQL